MSHDPYLYCQYADDLRQEVGGKHTVVGVYDSNMVVHGNMPAAIPKLVVLCNLFLPHPVTAQKISAEASFNDVVLQAIELPGEAIAAMRDATLNATTEGTKGVRVGIVLVFQPLLIEKEGKLRVKATVDDREIFGNSLPITVTSVDALEARSHTG